MADVTIKYKGANIATMDASGTKTLETSGKYCEGDVQVVYADPEKPTQSKSATPSLSTQTISPDSGKVLSSVSVSAITKELLASLDADFLAENIKKDVDLFGLLGTLEGGGTSGNFATGTFTTTDDITSNVVINHNLGVKPKFIIVLCTHSSAFSQSRPKVLSFYYIYQYSSTSYGMKYQFPGTSTSEYNSGRVDISGSGTQGAWYYVNVDETTFTLKQANISSTYGIGASNSFFWIAYGE